VFFNGERVARRDYNSTGTPTGVFYYFSDHLKTASVITDSAGNIKSESDYYPWGGELQFVNNDSNHYKFTGKERDTESGLDYFGARYYSNGLGRFISADWSSIPIPVPYADFSDPQSLNQYSYVRNIPTVNVDTDGHQCAGTCAPTDPEVVKEILITVATGGGPALAAAGPAAALAAPSVIGMGAVIAGPKLEQPDGEGCFCPDNTSFIWTSSANQTQTQPQLGQARGAGEEQSQSDIANDRARTNGGIVTKEIHGNSHATDKPAQGYSLRDKDTGEVLKYGETTRGTARYSKEYLDENNARMQFEAKGTKAQMHKWQHDKIVEYRKQHDGARPPLNKNDY
jgi:RHS repeat-associated protein